MGKWFLVGLLTLLAALPLSAAAPGVYAITGGTVHPVSGPPIVNGVVIVRDGLIEAVGANVAIPPDAATIDAAGGHVYPGFIDASTSFGIAAPAKKAGDAASAEPTADVLAARIAKFSDDDLEAKRATGVTTVVTAPSAGIFNGQTAIIDLGEGAMESRIVKSPAALQVSFNTRPTWTFPDSLMGVIAYIRQSLLDAKQYAAARTVYDKNATGLQRPQTNAALEALGPAVRRELPIVFIADSDLMMHRAVNIAKEMDVRIIIAGARQAYRTPGDWKDVPLLVSVKWPTAPAKDDREDQPLRVIRDRQLAPTTPAVLARNGNLFALVTGSGKTGDFLPGIRKAIDNGLSADDALRAVTLSPARILGVDRQLGSLDRGKIANVVISDKPIFDKDAAIKRVLIEGRDVRIATASEAAAKTSGASAIDGSWTFAVNTPEGTVTIQATLKAEDGKVTGTFSGDRGSGDIRNGTFDGTAVEFTIAARVTAETSDWVFRGTLKDGSISGNVTTTIGTFAFTGSKSK